MAQILVDNVSLKILKLSGNYPHIPDSTVTRSWLNQDMCQIWGRIHSCRLLTNSKLSQCLAVMLIHL